MQEVYFTIGLFLGIPIGYLAKKVEYWVRCKAREWVRHHAHQT